MQDLSALLELTERAQHNWNPDPSEEAELADYEITALMRCVVCGSSVWLRNGRYQHSTKAVVCDTCGYEEPF